MGGSCYNSKWHRAERPASPIQSSKNAGRDWIVMSKTCSVDGCSGRHLARGFCSKHYKRWRKWGNPMGAPSKPVSFCKVIGCSNTTVGRGLCKKHYSRWYQSGTVARTQTSPGFAKKHFAEYRVWQSMKRRCYDCRVLGYENYGGRGVTVCDRWLGPDGFHNFYEDMGPRPEGYSIDRIDVNGNYCPDNCRWASRKTQNNNKRSNIYITRNGVTRTLKEWCDILGVSEWAVRGRVKRGWNEADLFKPIRKMKYNKNYNDIYNK